LIEFSCRPIAWLPDFAHWRPNFSAWKSWRPENSGLLRTLESVIVSSAIHQSKSNLMTLLS